MLELGGVRRSSEVHWFVGRSFLMKRKWYKMGLILPKFIEKGWSYKDGEGKICLKDNAPEWARKEYGEFTKKINPQPDKKGKVIVY